MDAMHSCRCCLLRAPDKDLTTPYTYLGKTEIYSDMLKECFDIHLQLGVGGAGECGICAACVGRLRDASDFKLQVQRSQAELQARLQGALRVKEEEPAVESKMEDGEGINDDSVSDQEPSVKLEMDIETLDEDPLVKTEMPDEGEKDDELLLEERAAGLEVSDDAASDGDCVSPFRTAEEANSCDPCGKHLTGKSTLIEHVRGHAAQAHAHTDKCSCATCIAHSSSTGLSDKNTIIHKNEKTYCCDMCSLKFTAKRPLTNHIRKHMAPKRYSCTVCNKMFKQSVYLKRHQRIHTGEKPFSCAVCSKRFTQCSALHRHKIIHTGNKSYICVVCKKRFARKGDLVKHERLHTGTKPFNCVDCNKQFTQKSHLVSHRKLHTGEKPYSCVDCNKRFAQASNLARHKRSHTGEKPYCCDVCNARFADKRTLRLHAPLHTYARNMRVGEKSNII